MGMGVDSVLPVVTDACFFFFTASQVVHCAGETPHAANRHSTCTSCTWIWRSERKKKSESSIVLSPIFWPAGQVNLEHAQSGRHVASWTLAFGM
jgi:hypothetical protein